MENGMAKVTAKNVKRRDLRLRRAPKYHNLRTEYAGQLFASKKEASRAAELALAERAGLIRNLRTQVSFQCVVNEQLICRYVADFTYLEQLAGDTQWTEIVEDTKGVRTPLYKLKAKLVKALHGITIRET